MFDVFLANLVTYGLNQNILISNGYGALVLGREKKYRFFRHLNILFTILGIVICAIAMYFFNQFVIDKFDVVEIKVGVLVLLAGLYNLLISFLWGKMSNFGQYLYEKSCSYVFDTVLIVFVVMSVDMTLKIVPFLMTILAIMVVIFVTNLIMGFYIESINKSSLKLCVRNVSARLYLLAFFAVLLFYLSKLV
jgi:hypothetical protein